MPLEFDEEITFFPIPLGPTQAARQAVLFQKKRQALGSFAQLKDEAVAAVFSAATETEPTEHNRMRRLIAQVYTQEEIENYVRESFARLGLVE